jgi:UDP-N-acetylmuramoyl-L-alanyl-D-glutamate--2,6-diaminopimelate ligase
LEHGKPGDVIVLAGKGHETYQEVMGVAYPMDEREIVRSYFQNKELKKYEKQQHAGGNIPAGMVK